MIQILTVKNPLERTKLCQKAGLTDKEEYRIIAIHNDAGIISEGAIFKYRNELGEILWIDMGEDMDLADGLARAVLNIMEIRSVKKVTLPLNYQVLAQKLRFHLVEDHFEVNLEGYFCCSCQHK